jgi:hypothetical protein
MFFVHKGSSDYLETTIKHAKMKNPNVNIILLGEDIDDEITSEIKYEKISSYNNYSIEFEKHYLHLSDKEYDYELFCIQRWFIILEYMEKNDIKTGFYQDSDVVLDFNVNELKYDNKFWYCDFSGHTCAFTIDNLKKICRFILSQYTEKEKLTELVEIRSHMKHIDELEKWTNVTDMELLSLFIYSNREEVYNLGDTNINGIFGFNINAQDHTNQFHMKKYDFIGDKTKIYLFDNKLYVKNSVINKFERISSIHFHSNTKHYIESFTKYKNLNTYSERYYFDFILERWERDIISEEKDIIDYKISKEALTNLTKYNPQNIKANNIIKDFIKIDDLELSSIEKEIKKCSHKKYDEIKTKSILTNKKIVGWGCGNGINILAKYCNVEFNYLVDSDFSKAGKRLNNIEISNISKILEDRNNIFIIVLSVSYYKEIKDFLLVLGLKEDIDFVSMEVFMGYLSKNS